MAYAIGLDIGIASVGWATVKLDHDEQPWTIDKMGVRIFDKAEQPKTGESLAAPRRTARSMRRRLRRHRHRIERIKNLIITSGLLSSIGLDNLYVGQLEDIYQLRARALDKEINAQELARILLHLAQRRGFKSNRKTDKEDKEAGKLLTAVNANQARMKAKGYRTVGEMFYKDDVFKDHKRNKNEDYLATVQRDMAAAEANLILDKQMQHLKLGQDFKDKYLEIMLGQRSFDEGPGKGSQYAGDQIAKMIGNCTFEKDEQRAPKASYTFERFTLLEKINHIRLIANGKSVPLAEEQRNTIIEAAYASPNLTFFQIRKKLAIQEEIRFNLVRYDEKGLEANEKKEKMNCLKAYHEMRKAFDKIAKGHIDTMTEEQLNNAAYVLTVYKTDAKIKKALLNKNFSEEDIQALLNISGFSKFGHLSIKACDKLIPYLEQGMNYDDACEAAGYDFSAHGDSHGSKYLPAVTDDMDEITSPVVRRAVAQTIKVINAIIREHDASPIFINIELARELSKNFDERNKIKKSQDENKAANERLMNKIRTDFHKSNPTGMDLVKLKLYEEQGGICVYSQHVIDAERLFEPGYVEVDHVIPYSISFDDSYKNKVLVMGRENQLKGNRLPLQYMGKEQADKFTVWVNNNVKNYRKKQILLKKEISEDDSNKFKERNLQDTKHMAKFLYNYIHDYLVFAPSEIGRRRRVTAVSGVITAHMRKRWGIQKNRANGDLHHAVDALVIACTTNKMINEISDYSKYRENEFVQNEQGEMLVNRATGEILKHFPMPWTDFRAELEARLSDKPAQSLTVKHLLSYTGRNINEIQPIFVSRMPFHKVTGAAHKDTIKGVVGGGLVTVKRNLTDLKLKDGEIENYFNPDSDKLLYNSLKRTLTQAGGNAKKAFAEPFYKPKADGTPGPLVRKVKLVEKSTLNVSVHADTAVADNESMVRIDVFKVEGDGYYFVPIYVADTVKKELPSRAVVAGKNYSEWKIMDDKNFVFSVYPNDLLYVEHKDTLKFTKINDESDYTDTFLAKNCLTYYIKASISTASITVETQEGIYRIPSLGIKSLTTFEKYQVDVLGNYHKVNREKRQQFH
ncbi:MAG: type II CRISPR RNA-guided endonuclease Cas9 [Acidaminococcaceae bacterium]|nr:type II CRISPR RNA-guided endonuclease Cas9 [Acidaminococcaceae bacterium]